MRRLPPLNSLRAFEAAARHLSFTRAADELHVTPAAISHQVKALEEHCGAPLFRRLTRALVLTETGRAALPALREGFDKLAEGAARLTAEPQAGFLTVSVAPTFCARWLVPRLDRFRATDPGFDVRIDATDELADFASGAVDVAIRYGAGAYAGLVSACLMAEVVVPVASPKLLDGSRPLAVPADLVHHTLLHVSWKMADDEAPSWRMWLKAAGVTGIDADRGPRFNMDGLAIEAALAGHGVALVNRTLVKEDIAAGRLVRLFPPTSEERPSAFCYFLVHPPGHGRNPKVRAFRDWVLAEAAAG